MCMLTVMKGLPMSYSKDLQEDKEPIFDSADSLLLMLKAIQGMLEEISVNKDAMRKAAIIQGYSTATDLADWLVKQVGMPFRGELLFTIIFSAYNHFSA